MIKKTNSEKKKNKTVYVVLLLVFILMFIVCTIILAVSINNSYSRYTITNSNCKESVEYVRHDIILSPSFSKYGERSVMYDIFDNFSYAIIGIEIDDDATLDRFCNEMVYKYRLKLKVYNNSEVYSTGYNSFVTNYVECRYNEISMVSQDLFINSTIIHVNEYEILPERMGIEFRIPIVDYEDYRQTRTINLSDLFVKIDNESKTVLFLNRNNYFKIAIVTGDERYYTSCETKKVDKIEMINETRFSECLNERNISEPSSIDGMFCLYPAYLEIQKKQLTREFLDENCEPLECKYYNYVSRIPAAFPTLISKEGYEYLCNRSKSTGLKKCYTILGGEAIRKCFQYKCGEYYVNKNDILYK